MHKYAHIPSNSNVCTKYNEPMLYGNGETDLITKHDVNITKSVNQCRASSGYACQTYRYPPVWTTRK